MGIIVTLIIGFVVGLIAKMLTPGRDPSGFFITVAIGIAGSLVATYGGQAIGFFSPGGAPGFFWLPVGAKILLVVFYLGRSNAPPKKRLLSILKHFGIPTD